MAFESATFKDTGITIRKYGNRVIECPIDLVMQLRHDERQPMLVDIQNKRINQTYGYK